MKSLLLSILTLIISSFALQTQAQVTAVMQARVEVVSGAGFTTLDEHLIDFTTVKAFDNIETGSFTLVATPGSEFNVHLENTNRITNKNGESLTFETLDADQITSDEGKHQISVNGKVSDLQSLSGHYQGAVTAVVEYY